MNVKVEKENVVLRGLAVRFKEGALCPRCTKKAPQRGSKQHLLPGVSDSVHLPVKFLIFPLLFSSLFFSSICVQPGFGLRGNRDAVEEGVVVDEDSEGARGDGGCQK